MRHSIFCAFICRMKSKIIKMNRYNPAHVPKILKDARTNVSFHYNIDETMCVILSSINVSVSFSLSIYRTWKCIHCFSSWIVRHNVCKFAFNNSNQFLIHSHNFGKHTLKFASFSIILLLLDNETFDWNSSFIYMRKRKQYNTDTCCRLCCVKLARFAISEKCYVKNIFLCT